MKLSAALAPPLLMLVAVVGVEAVQSSRTADKVRREVELTEAAVGPSGLFNALQDERNRAAVDLANLGELIGLPVADNAAARQVTDEAAESFISLIQTKSTPVQEAYAPGFAAIGQLDVLRADVDAKEQTITDFGQLTVAADEVFARYSELIDTLLDANAQVTVAIDDPELRRGAELSFEASVQADVIARLIRHTLLTGFSAGNLDQTAEIEQFGVLYQQALDGERTIQQIATGEYQPLARRVHEAGIPFYEALAEIARGGVIDLERILETIDTGPDESYDGPFRDEVKEILEPKADRLAADVTRRVWWYRILAVGAVITAAVATWLVSRSITRPLRALTQQATDMADHRLPNAVADVLETPLGDDVSVPGINPVTVRTRDEVADVADALNTVQSSALDLAVEQAVLRRNIADSFVNLGRRNQNLLGRQLDFITELEHNETDPDTLANLFRLDHLATRMRRNAESLLVLAGIDPPRKWAAPVRVTDVIRAALGEVENYQRVTVRAVEPATILGTAAADLAHLLAELLENALIFSPQHQSVEVRGRAQPTQQPAVRNPLNGGLPRGAAASPRPAPDGPAPTPGFGLGYSLTVIDAGLGMPPDEIERANRRLAGAESFTIAPSKYLGHYVAGNLAARHDITVVLHASQPTAPGMGRGITATITLPPAIITEAPNASPPPPPGATPDPPRPAPRYAHDLYPQVPAS